MTGVVRVAVQVGVDAVRVATAVGGPPRVAVVPVEPGTPLPVLLSGLLPVSATLVLVHPVGVDPGEVRAAWAGWSGRVATVAEPLAAVHGMTPRPVAVLLLDVGRRGARVHLVRGDRIVGSRPVGPGGDALDAVVDGWLADRLGAAPDRRGAVARRVREDLSLLPSSVAAGVAVSAGELEPVLDGPLQRIVRGVSELRRALPDPVPVHLVGGVARTPRLAELLDTELVGADATRPALTVAARPDVAAVVGALAVPSALLTIRSGGRSGGPPTRWLPAPPPPRPPRRAVRVLAAAAVLVGLALLGTWAAPGRAPTAQAVPVDLLAQYGYHLRLPAGWAHTGGLPERRRTLLTPLGAPDGSDLIAVERTPLGYDADAEPERAAAELRAEFDAAVAAGDGLTGYDARAALAGRTVTAYREAEGRSVVRWYVLLVGDSQLSVGCRETPTGAAAVQAACAVVVGSLGLSG